MPTVRKTVPKNMEFHSILGLFPRLPVHVLEDVTKTEFQICFVARNLNEEHRSITLQTKNFPRRLQIHRYIECSQNIGWKMVATISLKMKNLGFEIFFESGFSDGNHCFK